MCFHELELDHSVSVGVRRQPVEISSPSLPFGFQGLSPGPRVWGQVSLPAQPS